MSNIIANVTDYFMGKSNEPANPDIKHNIYLLEEIKRKIDTGVFTRFFKKPTLALSEIVTYLLSLILLLIGLYFWNKIDNLLNVISTLADMHNIFSQAEWDTNFVSIIDILLLIISLLPGCICFLLGRSFTASRKKINTFIEIENAIDRVIFNLKNE